jgi:hypothetical protein
VAIPILLFLIKYGWPKIKDIFLKGVKDLEEQGGAAAGAN